MQSHKLHNVKLDNHSYEFVNKQIQEGSYNSINEVLIDSLKVLEAQKANQEKLQTLRKAIEDGENSGPAEEFDPEAILLEAKKEAGLIA